MNLVYIVEQVRPSGTQQIRKVYDTLEKAQSYIKSIPYIDETYPGIYECRPSGLNEFQEAYGDLGRYAITTSVVE